MLTRLLFVLLCALNLGAAGWLLLGHAAGLPVPPVTDPGVPALRVLSDVPIVVHPPGSTPAPVTSAPTQSTTEMCHTLGPFSNKTDAAAAMQVLSAHVARIRQRQTSISRPHGYWVYIPAAASYAAALDEVGRLNAKGITNYFVVGAGDQQNAISLGMFDQLANARQRLAHVQALGIAAKMKQRMQTQSAYWLDFAVPTGGGSAWKNWLPGRSDLHAKSIDCF